MKPFPGQAVRLSLKTVAVHGSHHGLLPLPESCKHSWFDPSTSHATISVSCTGLSWIRLGGSTLYLSIFLRGLKLVSLFISEVLLLEVSTFFFFSAQPCTVKFRDLILLYRGLNIPEPAAQCPGILPVGQLSKKPSLYQPRAMPVCRVVSLCDGSFDRRLEWSWSDHRCCGALLSKLGVFKGILPA